MSDEIEDTGSLVDLRQLNEYFHLRKKMSEEKVLFGSPTGAPCPSCGSPTIWKNGIYGAFAGCFTYPECKGVAQNVKPPEFGEYKDNLDSSKSNGEDSNTKKRGRPPGSKNKPKDLPASEMSAEEAQGKIKEALEKLAKEAGQGQGEGGGGGDSESQSPEDLWAKIRPVALPDIGKTLVLPALQEAAKTIEQQTKAYTDDRFAAISEALEAKQDVLGKQITDRAANTNNRLDNVESRINELACRTFVIERHKPDSVEVDKVEGVYHKAVEIVIQRISAGLRNIMLVGPSGSGKSRIAEDVSKILKLRFGCESCSAGMSESRLIGRSIPNLTGGPNTYEPPPSRMDLLYKDGGIMCLDEIDGMDPNVLIVMNSGLSNGHWTVPNNAEPVLRRHKMNVLIATANTYGNGANRLYCGRNQLDAATLSRFAGAVIEVDYDRTLEIALAPSKELRDAVWSVRTKVTENALRRVMGTRELINGQMLLDSGMPVKVVMAALTQGWTKDELSRVGI